MRALWVKAPFVLRRHPSLLAAVLLVTALAALAAASSPLVRAGVESESLQGQLRNMTPLVAGLEVKVPGRAVAGDRGRRAAAVRLARELRFTGSPVSSSMQPAQVAGPAGAGVEVVALARTGAVAHVHHETPSSGSGVWIADSTAKLAHLRPGGTLRLTEHVFFGRARTVDLRVAGIYRSLDSDRDNPYWANWLQDIRAPDPDSPAPPPFVLMSESNFQRVAVALARSDENRFEFPIDARNLTLGRAKALERRIAALEAMIERGTSPSARALGCAERVCTTSSSLDSALVVAASEVAAVSPTIALLATCGVLVALALSFSAGVFLVRRRAHEAQALFVRGASAGSFAARVALESLLPSATGVALGVGAALLALGTLAPAGTIDGGTVVTAALRAAAAGALAIAFVATGAAVTYPRDAHRRIGRRWVTRIPWELAPLAAAGALLAVVLAGRGLARDASGTTHPRLAVFVLPLAAVPGVAGLMSRIGRLLIRGRGSAARAALFLAVRRLAAPRGLLVAVVVATATAFGAFAYAAALSASLERSVAEKAWVGNGSDVQGLVDTHAAVSDALPFPIALVQIDRGNVAFASGRRVDLISGNPDALARTLRWGRGWSDDPRPLLLRLERASGGALAAIASPGAPEVEEIVDQGVRIPLRVIGHAAVPGATSGRPALLVSRSALGRLARRVHILDPAPQVEALVWAKGPPELVERILASSPLAPVFMTTPAHILGDPSVAAAQRSYRFVKLMGAAAATLSLLSVLLYLQARQRSQLIASALVRRMGLSAFADASALAVEAAAIVLFAGSVGGVVAMGVARPIAHHVDSLPQYAPSPVFTMPWPFLSVGLVSAVLVAASLGALAAVVAGRSDVGRALRVA